ncbi:hypothetical protein O181_075205 [Austropuccinia psidii MF-1]|uniref:Uncharacterized protein n=1 Tax=Austropuccinia psidii MF-1 TaxID=1389203 RepID=A0A9Q3FDY3_9BASI|nr:hypothetical protein [Austropuccinia psidii MF-1]
MSIPAGLAKTLHALYLLVQDLFPPSKPQKQQVENTLFEAIALHMDDQRPPVTFDIPNSTSNYYLSVEIRAVQYFGSFSSVNKVTLAPEGNEIQEGSSTTSTGALTPTLTGLVDNILHLIITFNLVQAHTKVYSINTQKIGEQLVHQGVDPLQALVTIQGQTKAGKPCYNKIAAFLTGGVCGLLVCSADYCITLAKGTLKLL